ncbi:MAG: TIGR03986 family CRISPR-associated RAMP protein [Anaerolineae bacterium]|nr:TIGR03986 family CRISPR-associated RAMP protein [Anaerolineales bacterium]MCQ3975843.1 TIGR03986 family CRISPR-associated RAMP protein [Anaerolineae bacterium]
MSWPKHQDPTDPERIAHAPYNFVPLPEAVVKVELPPDQDRYYTNASDTYNYTGYLDCTLVTLTPLYTRCMMTTDFYKDHGGVPFYDLEPEQQNVRAKFFYLHDIEKPVIPGSSLRGMARTLVQIAGYSKISPVSKEKIFYRAVAGGNDDPLADPYEVLLGKQGRKVKAGYLTRKDGRWQIQPAMKPERIGLKDKGSYAKIKDDFLKHQGLPGFLSFNDMGYRPQYHPVSFSVTDGKVSQIGLPGEYSNRGVLVCAGNMLETNSAGANSPRTRHSLVMGKNEKAAPLNIDENAITEYLNSLTEFQRSAPFDEHKGCLIEGNPVFYVEENGQVYSFGHSPNFRVPMRLFNRQETASPFDLVPEKLRRDNEIDLAEAIFGYVKDKSAGKGKARACAGRVFFSDAEYQSASKGVWLTDRPGASEANIITPNVLSGPKPTSFQLYLTQDNPDTPGQLQHYGSDKTVIRGHKLYWHKKTTRSDIEADPQAVEDFPRQYTRIQPVKEGVIFKFKVHFENLSAAELGALVWVLDLPAGHYHKLGMGKPLGLGSVAIKPRLFLNTRSKRYEQLFNSGNDEWQSGFSDHPADDKEISDLKEKFEKFILEKLKDLGASITGQFKEQSRIQELLNLLRCTPSPDRALVDYPPGLESFEDRPVLPTPQFILKNAEKHQQRSEWVSVAQVEAALAAEPPQLQYSAGDKIKSRIPEADRISGGKVYIRLENGEPGFFKMTEPKFKQVKQREFLLEIVEVTFEGYHLKIFR